MKVNITICKFLTYHEKKQKIRHKNQETLFYVKEDLHYVTSFLLDNPIKSYNCVNEQNSYSVNISHYPAIKLNKRYTCCAHL